MTVLDTLLARVEKPSRYLGGEIGAVRKTAAEVRFLLAFPDVYEVGMSHYGYQVLYAALNGLPWCAAERAYAPWPDMEAALRAAGLPLFSLETQTPLGAFDAIGFTLQFELCCAGVLQMLDLAGLPLRAEARGDGQPLVIGGGPCAANPEPWAPFFDALFIGEGEGAVVEIAAALRAAKARGAGRAATLDALADIPGMYLPARRRPRFEAGRLVGFALDPGEPPRVARRIVADFERAPTPPAPLLPNAPSVHDRLTVEVMRGCLRGCRFCQAGFIYRPVRERSGPKVVDLVRQGVAATGHDEVGFLSLSTGDWSPVQATLPFLSQELAPARIAMSLPSLRAESLRGELAAAIRQVRRTGFTIAPEAGTERLRRVINKPLTDAEILAAAEHAFGAGWEQLKLYFMIGLPTETPDDVLAIAELVQRVFHAGRRIANRARVNVTVSVFAPKAHTPFEREPMPSPDEIVARLRLLPPGLARGAVTFRTARPRMTLLEAALARADRRGGDAVELAFRAGARFAGWSEHFDFAAWERAFAEAGLDLVAQATRARADDELLPWSGVDIGTTPEYLRAERDRARSGELTVDCRTGQCHDCGVCAPERAVVSLADAAPSFAPAALPLPPIEAASQAPRFRYWLRFAKLGSARWLSHLEMTKVFARALRRAGLPVLYSSGFHPLPRLAFGPPLSAGVESRAEFADIALSDRMTPDEILDRLRGALPNGLEANEVRAVPENAPSLFEAIVGFEFQADLTRLVCPAPPAESVAAFLARREFPVAIERKGKQKTLDARPLLISAAVSGAALHFHMRHTHSEASVRPAHLAALLLGLPESAAPPFVLRKTRADLGAP